MAVDFNGSVYGNGTNSTSGANTVTHYHDRLGIKAAIEENIYAQAADRRNMPQKYGKTYKVSKWLHILDDDNMNDQGNMVWDEGTGTYVPVTDNAGIKLVINVS
jgi:hypothetical protein